MNIKLTSSSAALAKIHAKYGNRLKERDFAAMTHCRSVGEVAAYLKNHTDYAAVLADVNEATVHRGHLEELLRKKILTELAQLCRYDTSSGGFCLDYIVARSEIEQILNFLQFLGAGVPESYLFSLPLFFNRHFRFDLMQLSRVRSYDQLLTVLADTEYHKLLAPFADEAASGRIPIALIETTLYRYLDGRLFTFLRHIPGEQGRQLRQLFGTIVDAQNLSRMIRLKTYFHLSPEEIRPYLLPDGGMIPKRQREALLAADTGQELVDWLRTAPLGRTLPPDYDPRAEHLHYVLSAHTARHLLHFSTYSPVVMTAYTLLCLIELDNIINVIEGIRYGLAPQAIRAMLITA